MVYNAGRKAYVLDKLGVWAPAIINTTPTSFHLNVYFNYHDFNANLKTFLIPGENFRLKLFSIINIHCDFFHKEVFCHLLKVSTKRPILKRRPSTEIFVLARYNLII